MEEKNNNIDAESSINPVLMEFLDARTYTDKLNVFFKLNNVDDDMINTMAISIGTQIRPGTIEERMAELKSCLLTMEKYECSRLR